MKTTVNFLSFFLFYSMKKISFKVILFLGLTIFSPLEQCERIGFKSCVAQQNHTLYDNSCAERFNFGLKVFDGHMWINNILCSTYGVIWPFHWVQMRQVTNIDKTLISFAATLNRIGAEE